jgi:beta-aspartyl-peptidase (threonine type)
LNACEISNMDGQRYHAFARCCMVPAMGIPTKMNWSAAIHGGAGAIPQNLDSERRKACKSALDTILHEAVARLSDGEAAVDVVECVVVLLEDEPCFNAGCGAVYTREGGHELEAAIMDGATKSCGSVTQLTTVLNPIRLARNVMEQSPHVMLSGSGAEAFADTLNLGRVDNTHFDTPLRRLELERASFDPTCAAQEGSTVGAVAMDTQGRFASATSTGGMTAKWSGRIGDSPLIGSGTYADSCCAISCTGHGEEFIRHVVAHEISAMHRYGGVPLAEAAEEVLGRMPDGAGGVILVDATGSHAIINAAGMYRGLAESNGRFHTAIWKDRMDCS